MKKNTEIIISPKSPYEYQNTDMNPFPPHSTYDFEAPIYNKQKLNNPVFRSPNSTADASIFKEIKAPMRTITKVCNNERNYIRLTSIERQRRASPTTNSIFVNLFDNEHLQPLVSQESRRPHRLDSNN